MTVTPTEERPQAPSDPGASDAVTFAFGDLDAQLFGLARVGLATDESGARQASGLAVLFGGLEPIAVRTAGGLPVSADAGFEAVEAAGVRTGTHEPLSSWDVSFTSDDGQSGFALRFEALSPPGRLAPDAAAAMEGGMQGYEQLCRVRGVARIRGEERAVSCLGQRGHSWGAPDWERITLARTVTAWMDDDLAISLTGVRSTKAKHHADEALDATLFVAVEPGGSPVALTAEEARLSTTTDADGRQRRSSIEVFLDEEDPGHRAGGEVLCGTSLDLGRLQLDCSFFVWRMDGLTGVGRYDVLRRAA
ncbi:MAG: hypothetical protein H0V81_09040 [Solirubrobacterales bacterium]|nr:hypothetical protein [Solirubrobacterales bacterium]